MGPNGEYKYNFVCQSLLALVLLTSQFHRTPSIVPLSESDGDYSIRIGTATAWVEAGAQPGELRHLGAWATKIGEEVYARMSAERQLALQQASTHSAGMSLDALLQAASAGEQTGDAVLLPGAAAAATAMQTAATRGPATSVEPAVKRRRTQTPQSVSAAATLHAHFTSKTSDM